MNVCFKKSFIFSPKRKRKENTGGVMHRSGFDLHTYLIKKAIYDNNCINLHACIYIEFNTNQSALCIHFNVSNK